MQTYYIDENGSEVLVSTEALTETTTETVTETETENTTESILSADSNTTCTVVAGSEELTVLNAIRFDMLIIILLILAIFVFEVFRKSFLRIKGD